MTDFLPSTPSKLVVATTSTPPPINWATKPGTQAATNEEVPSVPLANSLSTPRRLIPIFLNPDYIGELQEAQAATNEGVPSVQLANSLSTPRRLIPIFIDPYDLCELQEALLRLAHNNPTVPTFRHHKEADHEEHGDFDRQSLQTSKADDRNDSKNPTSSYLTVSPPPSSQVLSQNFVSLSKKRYYVITIGKCAGVFYGEWYVNLSSDGCSLILTFLCRDNINHLVNGVLGAKFKGFPTKEKAKEAYLSAKKNGEIHIVRNPGDDNKYGPLFYAIQ